PAQACDRRPAREPRAARRRDGVDHLWLAVVRGGARAPSAARLRRLVDRRADLARDRLVPDQGGPRGLERRGLRVLLAALRIASFNSLLIRSPGCRTTRSSRGAPDGMEFAGGERSTRARRC